jgi:hypothetical protein
MAGRLYKQFHTTVTTTVQAAKEKIGLSQREVDDELQEAVSRMELLESRVSTALQDFRALLSSFAPACSTASDLSRIFVQAGGENPAGAALQLFVEQTGALLQNDFIHPSHSSVLSDVENLQTHFAEFARLRSVRHETRLLWSSLRDSLNAAAKSSRPPEEIGQMRIEFEKKTIELRSQTDQLKQRANALWEVRFTMFEQPLQRLVGLLFAFCEQTYRNLLPLEASLAPELLRQDFKPPPKI